MNAYEDNDQLRIDVCRISFGVGSDQGAPELDAHLHRWTLNLGTRSVREEQLDDRPVEFPRVPDELVGQQYRFGYALEFESGLPAGKAVASVLVG